MSEKREQYHDKMVSSGHYFADMVVGSNKAMRQILHTIARVAKTDINVLICGESGTGKELIAKVIHHNSLRHGKPFICIECTTITPSLMESELFGHVKGAFTGVNSNKQGLFEVAHQGTIFLDEIGDLNKELQGKLLRAIELKEFRPVGSTVMKKSDVRIIAATNSSLKEKVAKGSFRSDLYYRLSSVTLHLPPLRDRTEDIPFLAQKFLERNRMLRGMEIRDITNKAMSKLLAYHYPGNVRELEQVIQYGMLHTESTAITEESLPKEVRRVISIEAPTANPPGVPSNIDFSLGYKELKQQFLEHFERYLIQNYLVLAENSITGAAKLAGIDRVTFYRAMKKYGIKKNK